MFVKNLIVVCMSTVSLKYWIPYSNHSADLFYILLSYSYYLSNASGSSRTYSCLDFGMRCQILSGKKFPSFSGHSKILEK